MGHKAGLTPYQLKTQTDGQMGRLKCEWSNAQTDKHTETDRRTYRNMYGLTHRQADAGLAKGLTETRID